MSKSVAAKSRNLFQSRIFCFSSSTIPFIKITSAATFTPRVALIEVQTGHMYTSTNNAQLEK